MKTKSQKHIDSILAAIRSHGWTVEAFRNGLKKSGASEAEAKKLFPHGIEDIVSLFHAMIDDAMQARIREKRNFVALRVRDKITFAVRARLGAIEPYRDIMRRLLIWSLHPRNIRKATQQLWHAADMVWIAAGDTSTDYNYYTKRLLLIAVMKSTLSFWLHDVSAKYQETWAFLDRRIADVMMVGKGISVIKTVGISEIFSLVRNRLAG